MKKANIELNLFLPPNELKAYILKIKDEFDKDNSIVQTPLELLGEKFEKADNKKYPKKPKAQMMADYFFIYDYWKHFKQQNRADKDIFIDIELNAEVPYKEESIRKIRDTMKYYIDELHYKDLITGIATI